MPVPRRVGVHGEPNLAAMTLGAVLLGAALDPLTPTMMVRRAKGELGARGKVGEPRAAWVREVRTPLA